MEKNEIELKFLPKRLPLSDDTFPFKLSDYVSIKMSQGYISTSPTIRIRQENDCYVLTVKGAGDIVRSEYELSLTEDEFHNLLPKVETRMINKTRYIVPLGINGHLGGKQLYAEIDLYDDQLNGLVSIEVEFESLKDCDMFIPPEWFGKNVTYDNRFKNSNLAKYGLPDKEL